MINRASIIKDFLAYVKGRKFLYLRSLSTNGKVTTCDEEEERELIGDFASEVSINNKDNFSKIFEAFLTEIEDDKAYFTIVDENGFAGYQQAPVKKLLERDIECKTGTIFFVFMSAYKAGAKGDFIPWGEQSPSKKLVELLNHHYTEQLDNVYGWMYDRLIEYGKFKDGDKIIERLGDAADNYFKSKEISND